MGVWTTVVEVIAIGAALGMAFLFVILPTFLRRRAKDDEDETTTSVTDE